MTRVVQTAGFYRSNQLRLNESYRRRGRAQQWVCEGDGRFLYGRSYSNSRKSSVLGLLLLGAKLQAFQEFASLIHIAHFTR